MSDAVVNKAVLAERLKVSLPTLDRWVKKFTAFPVIQRGANGREWQFDAAAVFAFLRARKDEESASDAARDEQLAQLAFPFEPATPAAPGLSIGDQLKAAQLRRITREEAEKSGDLVPAAATRQAMFDAFVRQNRLLQSAITRECTELNLPANVLRRLTACIADAQRAWVAEMQLRSPLQPPEGLDAAA